MWELLPVTQQCAFHSLTLGEWGVYCAITSGLYPELFINPISLPCWFFSDDQNHWDSKTRALFLSRIETIKGYFFHNWLWVVCFLVSIISLTSSIEECIMNHSCFKLGNWRKCVFLSMIPLCVCIFAFSLWDIWELSYPWFTGWNLKDNLNSTFLYLVCITILNIWFFSLS